MHFKMETWRKRVYMDVPTGFDEPNETGQIYLETCAIVAFSYKKI